MSKEETIYHATGKAVGFHNGTFVYTLQGHAVGQLHGTHVYTLHGHYVGELDDGMILNKNLNPGSVGSCGAGSASSRGAGNRGARGTSYPDVSDKMFP